MSNADPSRTDGPRRTRPRHLLPSFFVVSLPALLLLAHLLTAPAAESAEATPVAAPAPVQVEAPAEELARIRAALERMAALLEEQSIDRRAGLALQRLDVENERVARLEGRLAAIQDTRSSVAEQRLHLQESYRRFLRQEEASGGTLSEEERLVMREEMDAQLDLLEARLADLDGQASEVENRLTDRRRAMSEWESFVDRQLQE